MQGEVSGSDNTADKLRARIAALESELAAERARAAALEAERDKLRDAYRQLQIDIELLRRRIFVAKAERVDTRQLELEFASKKKELDALARRLRVEPQPPAEDEATEPRRRRRKPKGRRNLAIADLPVERHELLDPDLEGKLERIGFEEVFQIGWRKGGPIKVVIARAKYRAKDGDGVVTTPMPKRTFPRLLAAPSLLAKIAVDKFADGLPLFRQEQRFARDKLALDRGTMSRWLEDLGMTVGSVVVAMRDEAMQTAFCIATDATGVAVQPEPSADKGRRPCRRGHFFVMLPTETTSSSSTPRAKRAQRSRACSAASPATCRQTPSRSTTCSSPTRPPAPPRPTTTTSCATRSDAGRIIPHRALSGVMDSAPRTPRVRRPALPDNPGVPTGT